MRIKPRAIIACIAPIAILCALLFAVQTPAHHHADPHDQYLPGDSIDAIHPEEEHDGSRRRRGILLPKRVKVILSYQKTALA